MPRMTTPLTDTKIRQSKPRDKEYNLNDGDGLALRVKPKGSKLWLFNYYRPYTKKRTNLGLGTYPDVSLADARSKRRECRKLLAQDIDPKEHREEQQVKAIEEHLNTFKHISSQWLDMKRSSITHDHAEKIWGSLELHIFPDMGNIPIHKIRAKNTIKVIQPVANKGSLETVKRLCQRINEIMVFAVNTGIIESNALAGIKQAFGTPTKKNLPTIKPDQLPELMKAIHKANIRITTRKLIEWQLHTMVRPGEAAGTRWDEIDFTKKCWDIPASRMKAKRAFNVPLSDQAIEILEQMKPLSAHRDYVFLSNIDPKKHANTSTANVALKRMGFAGTLVAHGLRSLASTTLNEEGFDYDVIEASLAHVEKNDVRRAYNRAEYLTKRRDMLNWWSNHIETALSDIRLNEI